MKKKFISKFTKLAFLLFFATLSTTLSLADENIKFNKWLEEYKNFVLNKGVSKVTVNNVFKNVKFLPQVIKYDRKQPEFFEDTLTYISKRATKNRKNKAIGLLSKNKKLFNEVELKFKVEKEILLALWGIETNFGKHVGKMDIISSLAKTYYFRFFAYHIWMSGLHLPAYKVITFSPISIHCKYIRCKNYTF